MERRPARFRELDYLIGIHSLDYICDLIFVAAVPLVFQPFAGCDLQDRDNESCFLQYGYHIRVVYGPYCQNVLRSLQEFTCPTFSWVSYQLQVTYICRQGEGLVSPCEIILLILLSFQNNSTFIILWRNNRFINQVYPVLNYSQTFSREYNVPILGARASVVKNNMDSCSFIGNMSMPI